MPKILIIHHSGIIGGAGVSLTNTIEVLSQNNDVVVMIPSEPDDMRKKLGRLCTQRDVQVIESGRRIGAVTYYSGGDKFLSPRFLYRLVLVFTQWRYWNGKIADIDPDLVITNSMILAWMSRLPEVQKRKSVCFVRETFCGSADSRINTRIRDCLDEYSRVSFLSQYDKNIASLQRADVTVIRNFIDANSLNNAVSKSEARTRLKLDRDSFYVLYVGGVSQMKGFDLAVKAVLQCDSRVELMVAGLDFEDRKKQSRGKLPAYESDIFRFIQQKDIDHRIHLVGRQMNMTDYYAACDVVLFPMRSPHQARPAFEAGWFSKPVIITDFENIHEDVKDGYNGLLVPCGDVSAIKHKILYLLEHPDDREAMGYHNYEMCCENHSKEKSGQSIRQMVMELIQA